MSTEKTSQELDEEFYVAQAQSKNEQEDIDADDQILLTAANVQKVSVKDLAVLLLRPTVEIAIRGALNGPQSADIRKRLKLTDAQVEELATYLVTTVGKLLTKAGV